MPPRKKKLRDRKKHSRYSHSWKNRDDALEWLAECAAVDVLRIDFQKNDAPKHNAGCMCHKCASAREYLTTHGGIPTVLFKLWYPDVDTAWRRNALYHNDSHEPVPPVVEE